MKRIEAWFAAEMKIVSFVVRVECPGCKGQKLVPGSRREYGEMVYCARCDGGGTILGDVSYEDFAKLMDGLVKS